MSSLRTVHGRNYWLGRPIAVDRRPVWTEMSQNSYHCTIFYSFARNGQPDVQLGTNSGEIGPGRPILTQGSLV